MPCDLSASDWRGSRRRSRDQAAGIFWEKEPDLLISIHYLNTDLDLISAEDLSPLAQGFEAAGLSALHVSRGEDGLWRATFETSDPYREPEPNIAAMLRVIESMDGPLLAPWSGCQSREFNIGYECGDEPWAFNQGLSSEILARIAAAGASLRITLYPPTDEPATEE